MAFHDLGGLRSPSCGHESIFLKFVQPTFSIQQNISRGFDIVMK